MGREGTLQWKNSNKLYTVIHIIVCTNSVFPYAPFSFNYLSNLFCHVGVVSFCTISYLLHGLSKEQTLFLCSQRIAKDKAEELNPLLQVNTCVYIFMYKYLYFSQL